MRTLCVSSERPQAKHAWTIFRVGKEGLYWSGGKALELVGKLLGFGTDPSKDADDCLTMNILGAATSE